MMQSKTLVVLFMANTCHIVGFFPVTSFLLLLACSLPSVANLVVLSIRRIDLEAVRKGPHTGFVIMHSVAVTWMA